jgi:hypothetical protein
MSEKQTSRPNQNPPKQTPQRKSEPGTYTPGRAKPNTGTSKPGGDPTKK